ncbi:MAG: cation:proton antiporter [Bryobacteraceae bacterium]
MGLAADFVLIVVAGLLGGLLARALRLPLLVGYVLAGVFVGPHTAGPTVAQIDDIETLAEIGVALLLFSIGLEVSFRDLSAVRRVATIGGPLQVVVTIALGALAAACFLGFRSAEPVWFGAMISVSSTMVVLKTLGATGMSSTLASRVMIALLLVQDLAVIPMLIVLPQLSSGGTSWAPVGSALASAVALVAAVYVAGTRLLPILFRRILAWGSRELFLVAVVAAGVGIGAAMHAAGFSFALGAFVAGLALSESEFRHQALADVIPLRDIFGLLFFVSVGMLLDPVWVARNAGAVAAAIVGIVAGKALVIGVITRSFGYRFMAPWIAGLGLSQIGEFSFVLARTALHGGFVSKPLYDLVLAATVLSMALSPLIASAALPLGRAWQRRFPSSAPLAERELPAGPRRRQHVVVGGFGRTGRAAAMALRQAELSCVVVESNYTLATESRNAGFETILGDISNLEILHAAGIDQARVLLLTIPEKEAVEAAAGHGRRMNPELAVVARGADMPSFHRLREIGVSAIQAESEAGLEMVRVGLLRCGRTEDEIQRIGEQIRRELYRDVAE